LEEDTVRFSQISSTLAEYRNLNESNKRLFRLNDADVSSMAAVYSWIGPSVVGRKIAFPSKIPSKKDLLEIARSLLAGVSAQLLSKGET
jgi:hypothetical protein